MLFLTYALSLSQGGRVYSDISRMRRLGLFLGGFKILNFIIFGVFRKINIFWGYGDFVDIFWGSSQNWASFRLISMHFRVFF